MARAAHLGVTGLLAVAALIVVVSIALHHHRVFVSASSSAPKTSSLPRFPRESPDAPSKKVTLRAVQIIHRHGDRTPITPMKNETFWGSILPPPHVLEGIAKGTKLAHDDNSRAGVNHAAGGKGVFGQLSQLGLLQMVDLGNRLREELHLDVAEGNDDDIHHEDEHGNKHIYGGKLFHEKAPLHPRRIKVTSTNFPRTIQSVQGLLVGLFPDGIDDDHHVHIDVRKTNEMIPDPQPRRTQEQIDLEKLLAARPHLAQKEEEMRGLAVRATDAIRHTLGDDYEKFIFGVGEENGDSSSDGSAHQTKPLPWSQLAEITTCLKARDMLPDEITDADQEAISGHAAWRWFENLRNPRLARLAMYEMVQDMVNGLHKSKNCPRKGTNDDEPLLHVFSAHDSTLMGLICAFHLENPSQWPHYASYIKVELIEVEDVGGERPRRDYFVRFSLNGEVLRSAWSRDEESGDLSDYISLDKLTEMVNKEHHDDEAAVMKG